LAFFFYIFYMEVSPKLFKKKKELQQNFCMGIRHVLRTIRGASSCNDAVKDKSYESSGRNEGTVMTSSQV
jgi:hypothetical protein